MLKTIILLIAALLIIPFTAIYLDDPLTVWQSNMLHTSVYIMLGLATYCFITGELTGNNSQVDKLWSILPVVYTFYFAYASGWNSRITLMAVLVAVWGIRLTYNFSRRGAYSWKFWSGTEDYRWQILRKEPMFNSKIKWMAFNLFFISLYQNGLILLFTLPSVLAATSNKPLGIWDVVLALLMLFAIAIEYIADQQQWNFQCEKNRRINAGEPLDGMYKNGFVSSGLWKFVRHPNYTAEQAVWILFYGFSITATGKWQNWSAAGFVLLLLLFQGSSDFSEKISESKYSNYAYYKKRTGRFLPRWKR
jgi:steroid 5-alpha reductase family enzyme